MNQISSLLQVRCRPASASDHADVSEFCKGIWEGGDYVPEAWEEWLNDPRGLLAVAETDGHVIGCSKITWMCEGQWWLEGFRVDPKYQGLRVGSRIHNYVTDWWLEHGDGILRLMTGSDNFPVHQVCNKTGYVKTHEVCRYHAAPLAEPIESFSPVMDLHEATKFAMASESIQTTDGLSDFGWQIGRLDRSLLESYAGAPPDDHHTYYWWKDRQGLLSVWENEDEDKRTLCIGVLACALTDMPTFLMDVRKLAAQQKFDSLFQIAFDIPQITTQLEAAGFERHWKRGNAFIFEKKHPGIE